MYNIYGPFCDSLSVSHRLGLTTLMLYPERKKRKEIEDEDIWWKFETNRRMLKGYYKVPIWVFEVSKWLRVLLVCSLVFNLHQPISWTYIGCYLSQTFGHQKNLRKNNVLNHICCKLQILCLNLLDCRICYCIRGGCVGVAGFLKPLIIQECIGLQGSTIYHIQSKNLTTSSLILNSEIQQAYENSI